MKNWERYLSKIPGYAYYVTLLWNVSSSSSNLFLWLYSCFSFSVTFYCNFISFSFSFLLSFFFFSFLVFFCSFLFFLYFSCLVFFLFFSFLSFVFLFFPCFPVSFLFLFFSSPWGEDELDTGYDDKIKITDRLVFIVIWNDFRCSPLIWKFCFSIFKRINMNEETDINYGDKLLPTICNFSFSKQKWIFLYS